MKYFGKLKVDIDNKFALKISKYIVRFKLSLSPKGQILHECMLMINIIMVLQCPQGIIYIVFNKCSGQHCGKYKGIYI